MASGIIQGCGNMVSEVVVSCNVTTNYLRVLSMTTRVTFRWENFDNVILARLPFPQVFQVKIIDNLIGLNLCKRLTLNSHTEIKECNTVATIKSSKDFFK